MNNTYINILNNLKRLLNNNLITEQEYTIAVSLLDSIGHTQKRYIPKKLDELKNVA